MILRGKIVTLRPIEKSDLEFVRSLINDPDMERTIVGWSWPISAKDEEAWYNNFQNSASSLRFIIETAADGIVGLTGLANIDWKNGSAKEAGIRVRKDFHTRGIATDAYMTMFRYAFNELRLHRISTSALEDNAASLRFQEKCGCKREGLLREAIFKGGEYKNLVLMGILKEEYDKYVELSNYWDS